MPHFRHTFWLFILFALLAALGTAYYFSTHSTTSEGKGLRVLFIGNSYTSANDLPTVFQNMAMSAGYPKPFVMSDTPGGMTLTEHATSTVTQNLIAKGTPSGKHWDAVVLQEQSEEPAYAYTYARNRAAMDGAVFSLYTQIQQYNPSAHVVLYETWARSAELWKNGQINTAWLGKNPDDMQFRIHNSYQHALDTIGTSNASVAWVGDAWQINNNSSHPIELYSGDGSHPTYAGTYLAALVLFSKIYNTTPEKVTYTGSLSADDAATLKDILLNNPQLLSTGTQ